MIKYEFIENFTKVEMKAKNDTTVIEINENHSNGNIFSFESNYYPQFEGSFIKTIEKIPPTWKEVFNVTLTTFKDYEPCDSIGLLVPNSDFEDSKLLELCEISQFSNQLYKIEKSGLQSFSFTGTLHDFIKYRMDITTIPKKKALFELSKKLFKTEPS